jgi:hypothetical protein
MSLQRDITYSVKQLTQEIKVQIERNLVMAVASKMLTIDQEKIPGICKLANDSIDQALMEKSDLLVNTIKAYSKK